MLRKLLSYEISRLQNFACNIKKMSIFTGKYNNITGKFEWEIQNENYDYHQEIASASFADMLHDTDRNQKYYAGIKMAISKMHQQNKKAHVIDIGTGTGLLAMMAIQSGADSVVACEAFQPMAECAKQTLKKNGFAEKIQLIPKRSTDITVGPGGDMKCRANILVTEVFDTELIGEGALHTFKHAHDHLLEEDCIVVPWSATVYALVVESPRAQCWNRLNPWTINEKKVLDVPTKIMNCPGAAAVHDIQLHQFPLEEFKIIVPAKPVFKFVWGKPDITYQEICLHNVQAVSKGQAEMVFMWWTLDMDIEGSVLLSCAPEWSSSPPWRDHWMQAVYYLPQTVAVNEGDSLVLCAGHDDFSLWFNLSHEKKKSEMSLTHPICECALHIACARTRIGAMNENQRRQKWSEVLSRHVSSDSVCVCVSDGSILGLVAASLGARTVHCVETVSVSRLVLQNFITHNKLENKVFLWDSWEELASCKDHFNTVNLVFGEPHFYSALLPWHNIHFSYICESLSKVFSQNVKYLLKTGTLWAIAVEFDDLWKIRSPLRSVEGFDMEVFDSLIEASSKISDSAVEPQPLWEYPCKALSKPFQLMEWNLTKSISDIKEYQELKQFTSSGTCHGFALWAEWMLEGSEESKIVTGPIEMPKCGEYIKWDMYTRQGVYFLHPPQEINPKQNSLQYSISFNRSQGDADMKFLIVNK